MVMWGSVPVNNFIVPFIHIQIGLGNYVLSNLLDFVECDVEKLSTGEEVSRNTLVTVNQVISRIHQDRQMWDVNVCVML